MERFGVNASKSRSEVTPREWFETYGSKPELRGPPKRRHFAAITKVAETRPFQPCAASIYQQQKNAGFQRVSFKTLWASVGGEPTVLTLGPVGRCGPVPTTSTLKLNLKAVKRLTATPSNDNYYHVNHFLPDRFHEL